MSKLDDTLSRLFGGSNGLFGNRLLIVIAIVFLVLGTDLLDNLLEDDRMWVWIILIILLLFNFDDTCC